MGMKWDDLPEHVRRKMQPVPPVVRELMGMIQAAQEAQPVSLILPYPPSANRYWRNVRGRMVVSEEARNYKAKVAMLCKGRGLQPVNHEVAVTITLYRPAKRGDLDNTFKVVLDSLNGICFVDDKQVRKIHAERFEDKNNPRAEIIIGT